MQVKFQTVPDTNVIIAAHSGNPKSPNKEYYERWLNNEFDLLYSDDTLAEYALKLQLPKFGLSLEDLELFIGNLSILGIEVEIKHYHLKVYPEDSDDISFILCAENGNATHVISYDRHILDLQYRHKFTYKICKILEFLQELRET